MNSIKIADAGMYSCQTENTIHKRFILTVIRENTSLFCMNIY